jgi:hypothetical protein
VGWGKGFWRDGLTPGKQRTYEQRTRLGGRRVPLYRTGRILDNAVWSANGSFTSMIRNLIPPSAGRHAVGDRSSCRWVVAAVLAASRGWPVSACPGASEKQDRMPVRGACLLAKSNVKRPHAVNRRIGPERQHSPVDRVLDRERAILPNRSEASR